MSNCQNAVMTRVPKEGKTLNRGFSLIEMMVVLLIISIILAATAPIAAKKMARDMASGASAWIYTNNDGSIGYNVSGKDISAIIGTTKITNLPNGIKAPRLVLAGDTENPAFVFARRNGEYAGQINMTENQVTMNGGTGAVGANSVAIGMKQAHNGSEGTVAIGYDAGVNGVTRTRTSGSYPNRDNIAIGNDAKSLSQGTVAIGHETRSYGIHSISIGNKAWANANTNGTDEVGSKDNGIAIGNGARAQGNMSVAIGLNAQALSDGSIAIGNNVQVPATDSEGKDYSNHVWIGGGNYVVDIPGDLAAWKNVWANGGLTAGWITANGNLTVNGIIQTTNDNGRITLGYENNTIYIPGNLVVDQVSILGARGDTGRTFIREQCPNRQLLEIHSHDDDGNLVACRGDGWTWSGGGLSYWIHSDKRLKNIGKKYTSGLEALKKLDIYNFTFKADEEKTPHVGVIAQDLQKVFPNAVTKGDDGYLRIRWDEMFYAVINAVKELDAKVNDIIAKITNHDSEITALKTEMQNLKNVNSELIIQNQELKKQNAEFEKRLTKLEKKDK